MTAPLVLASGSPRRAQLLAELSVPFEVCGVAVDERRAIGGGSAVTVAAELALAKARAAAAIHPHSTVIGADTLVVLHGEILGKPQDAAVARHFLQRMSGARLDVVTAVAVVEGPVVREESVTTTLLMRPITERAIDDYLLTDAAFDKAGGLEVQDRARPFVARVEGCWTNVVGLPLCACTRLLDLSYPPGACVEP